MQYTGDTRFYMIDEFIGDSNFQATKGVIPFGSISLSSNKDKRFTSQQNMIYELRFTPTHDANQNSKIEV